MANLGVVFSDPEMTNWLKAWLAINIAKDGLQKFVADELDKFRHNIYQQVRTNQNLPSTSVCTSCSNANLLKCPIKGLCKRAGNTCRTMHADPTKQCRPCPNRLCDGIRDEIIKAHRFNGPSWKNTSAEQWTCNYWEVAKCFMPPDGYSHVNSIQNTDFNGVISVMLNCTHFDSKISFSISPQNSSTPCLLTKTRELCKAVRHSSDCRVTSTELNDYFVTLCDLLSDPLALANDSGAQEAVIKLNELQNDRLSISVTEICPLLKASQEELREAKQVSEEAKSELQAFINRQDEYAQKLGQLQACVDSLKKTDETDCDRDVEDFRRRLIKHFKDYLTHIPVSPLMPNHDKPLLDLYITPAIHRIEIEKDGSRNNTGNVYNYKDIFKKDAQNTTQHIFLQGEPGKGKTTFAAKLVLDWCNTFTSEVKNTDQQTDFNDIETLHEFKFVFLISLRESRNQRKVIEMIKQQIIEMLYDDADEVEAAYTVLKNVLKTETCLVVQDGLDEWFDPDGQCVLPMLAAPSIVFITTRPWKMSDERLKTSKIDCLLEICGVKNPFDISRKVMKSMIGDDIDTEHKLFKSYIRKNELLELLETPMMITLVVSLWLDETCLSGSSCEIYSILLDSFFKKASSETSYFQSYSFKCLRHTKYIKPNLEHFEAISKAAFHLMFAVEKETSLVFSDAHLLRYLSESQKMFALTAGILTERKLSTLCNRPSTCSFIHKSVQEFLAAIYIASDAKLIDEVIVPYFNNNPEAYIELSLVFKFLCGLHIAAANQLSILMDCAVLPHSEYDPEFGFSMYRNQGCDGIGRDLTKCSKDDIGARCPHNIGLYDLQNLNVSGFQEANANGVRDDEINLHQKWFSFFKQGNEKILKRIFSKITSDVVFIYWNLSCKIDLNFSSKPNLKKLFVFAFHDDEKSILLPNTLRDLKSLEEISLLCICNGIDLSEFKNLKQIHLGEQITLLPTGLRGLIKLERIKLRCKCDELDLSACQSLNFIDIGQHITLLPNTLRDLNSLERINLKCHYDGLDMCEYQNITCIDLCEQVILLPHSLRDLQKLKRISLKCKCDGLDLSRCQSLEDIFLSQQVTLLTYGLRGLNNLKSVALLCKCDGLDLSRCQSLEDIFLSKQVTLLTYDFSGLNNLKSVALLCKCDRLDLSRCQSLEKIFLSEQVTLLPYALRGLNNLEMCRLWCRCDEIDMSSCQNLKAIEIGTPMTVLPNGLRSLLKLELMSLRCNCDGLDLSGYHSLQMIYLCEQVTLLPNALRGLIKLVEIHLRCKCDGLDLSGCHGLQVIELGEQVILLPNAFRDLNDLSTIVLKCKCDELDLTGCHRLCDIFLGEQVTLLSNAVRDLNALSIISLKCPYDGLDISGCHRLNKIDLGEQVTLLPNACRDLKRLETIMLKCKCDGLDLSGCHRLKYIYLDEQVTLLPNAVRNLDELTKIVLHCKCDGLDLSGCHSLSDIYLGKQVILLPNAVRKLTNLETITLKCKCDGLDLSGCHSLSEIYLGKQVTLLPNAVRKLNNLKKITLKCKCDWLDLFGCHSLSNIHLGKQVILLPNAVRKLTNLETITLKCKCDGLDVSGCHSLSEIYLGKQVTLLPNAVRKLNNLETITLKCKCDWLDLSGCHSLNYIYLDEQVTLLPNAVRKLNNLETIFLYCKCDRLDLSGCHSLNDICLGKQVTLLPNGLRYLNNLGKIKLNCKYDCLDLSECHSLENISLGEHVTLLPNALHGLNDLNYISLTCKYDRLDLSSCHSLREIDIGEKVIMVPNALKDISGLESIKLRCNYDGLDLSLSPNLKRIDLGEQVTLVKNCLQKLCDPECVAFVTLYRRTVCMSVDPENFQISKDQVCEKLLLKSADNHSSDRWCLLI